MTKLYLFKNSDEKQVLFLGVALRVSRSRVDGAHTDSEIHRLAAITAYKHLRSIKMSECPS